MIHTPSHQISTDTAPPAAGAIQPAADVQRMFDEIAVRYDLLNHLLSAGVDHLWWRRAARTLRPVLQRPEAAIVDLCCGTGDMTLALLRHRPSTSSTAPLKAVDFSHNMLTLGHKKFNGKKVIPVEADALHLPLPSGSHDLISSAFGFRNLASYEHGLAEIFRVLRPGGQLAILECNQPEGFTGKLYNLYFKKILPRVGGLLSSSSAYTYLPASVERFPRPPRMLELIHNAGFHNASWTSYTFGVVGLYRAVKP